MSYQTSAEAFHSKTPIILVTITIGGTVYRWSTHDIATRDGMYEGRLIDGGVIDREVVTGVSEGDDISLQISNHDGALDALVSDFVANSYIKGSVVIKRGFLDLAYDSFKTAVTLDIVSIVGYSDSRVVKINLGNESSFLTGTIEPPTVGEVIKALKIADPVNFTDENMVTIHHAQRKTVPILVGSPAGTTDRRDGWVQAYVATKTIYTGQIGTIAINGALMIAAVSKYGFNLYGGPSQFWNGVIYKADGVERFHDHDQGGGVRFSFSTQDKVITLNDETWHVLLIQAGIFDEEAVRESEEDTPLYLVRPQPLYEGTTIPKAWTLAETVQGIYESATGNESLWGSIRVTADWDLLSESTEITSRYRFTEDTDALPAISTVTSQSFVDTYVSKTSKLGVANITPIPGPSPDYSSKLLFSEEKNIVELSVSYPAPGSKWGIATRVNVGYGDQPGVSGDGTRVFRDIKNRGLISNMGAHEASVSFPSPRVYTQVNEEAETAHGKEFLVDVGGDTVPSQNAAWKIANRVLSLRAIPRPIISLTATIEAIQVELGDIVRVKHSAAPWSGEHVGIIYAIADDLETHTVQLTVVDLNSYLTGKTFFYNTRANWVHADTTDPNSGAFISITNGSNTVTASIEDTFDNVSAGDILRIDEGSNHFEVIIASSDQSNTIVTENGGGGYGITSDDYVTDGSITGWSILRSQATRNNKPILAGVEIDDKYGAYADDADDLFIDDTTEPYIYR